MTQLGAATVTIHPRDAVLTDLRGLFDEGLLSNLADGELLDRFTTRTEEVSERAFGVLIKRHGPMVLRVCRNVLGDPHDVEDAFQATFLILLRKASSIRKQSSCGSWLHGVALRASLRIRNAAASRRNHERRVAVDEGKAIRGAEPNDDVRGVIDEELGRLRDRYRTPLVLCYLEGQTCEQAAHQLGWPVGTVKSRLARGRERLRSHLVRRGLAPALGLAAGIELPSLSRAEVPGPLAARVLAETTRFSAGETIRGSVAMVVSALAAADGARSLSTRALRMLTVMLGVGLAVSAAGLGFAIRADAPPTPARSDAPPAETGPLHARVIDAAGRGAGGVEVLVFGEAEPAPRLKTDAEGRFEIPRAQSAGQLTLLARTKNALGWTSAYQARFSQPGTVADPLLLKLHPRTRTIDGAVSDPDGRPIVGVRVVVASLGRGAQSSGYVAQNRLAENGWPLGTAVSDAKGRYLLSLPEHAAAGLTVAHPRFVGPTIVVREEGLTVEPATLEPAGGITGTVTDSVTGAPVAGAAIGAQLLDHREVLLNGAYGQTMSDRDGRFTVSGLQAGVYNVHLWKVPGRERATARAIVGIRVRAGEDATAELDVMDGVPLHGVVRDAQTDRPVPGAEVGCYGPAHPRSGAAVEPRTTDAAGQFTFFVPPGQHYVYVMDRMPTSRLSHSLATVSAQGASASVRLIREADPNRPVAPMFKPMAPMFKEAVKETIVQRKAGSARPKPPEGRTLIGQVLDSEGKPIPGVSVYLDMSKPRPGGAPPTSASAASDREGVFKLPGLPKGELSVILRRPDVEPPGDMLIKSLPADRDTLEVEFGPRVNVVAPLPPKAVNEPLPRHLKDALTFVNLEKRGNEFLADGPGGGGNDLDRLPRGMHKLGDAYFRLGERMVHLRGRNAPGLPETFAAIVVGARADRLQILHGVQQVAPPGSEVASYTIHFADGTSERIPVVYGQNVANWWSFTKNPQELPANARIAWSGTNDVTDLNPGVKLRLYATTWSNPHPERVITSIDASSKDLDCDLFLVAVTLERDGPR